PVVYWSLHHLQVVGGIQVTGSHNPPEYNGFKLCVGTDSLHGDGIQQLRELAAATWPTVTPAGTVQQLDLLEQYAADILAKAGRVTRRLRVVFDCGNGTTSVVAGRLFGKLDIESHFLFCESDGTFPNHHPDPTVVENLSQLIDAVLRRAADVGIAFDGDGDRIGVVDSEGEIVWGDQLLIIYARDVLARSGPGQRVIFDVKCSQALPQAIERAGGVPVMWKTGHSLIKEKMRELGAPIAGEMSGHMFFKEGFYGHDDALYAAARLIRILAESGRSIRDMLADVPRYVSTPEIRIECSDERKFAVVQEAARYFKARYRVVDVDGVRILFEDGWGLLRASNTQPVLVARYEATTPERLQAIRSEVEGWLRGQGVAV
ncbi:MAG TPA: phosphomannomutase/phosphoglucomutase, partial [Gemmatimonadaceae bacterium]|nr:phosphomannomutase/phosphoglucomutase [Gemmatimonadaceae bacterium]